MAKKTLLGIDIGHDSLKLALVHGNEIKKTVLEPIPDHLVQGGRAVSIEAMGSLIRETMKKNRMKASQAALILSQDHVFLRNVNMAVMTEEQLIYNLPYEFRDYITDELKNYIFDYAMVTDFEDKKFLEGEEPKSMELLAVATPVSYLEECKAMLRKAGLKLAVAAPVICGYSALIRRHLEEFDHAIREYCIIDLGAQSIRMYMFQGDSHMVTRVLEIGMSTLDEAVADAYNVDIHVAHTYVQNNHNNCLQSEICEICFNNISVELMRAINFYRFSNRDSELEDVFLCGGGAAMEGLRNTIAESLQMHIHSGAELLGKQSDLKDGYRILEAVGITQN